MRVQLLRGSQVFQETLTKVSDRYKSRLHNAKKCLTPGISEGLICLMHPLEYLGMRGIVPFSSVINTVGGRHITSGSAHTNLSAYHPQDPEDARLIVALSLSCPID
ncbi:hypothetical protein BLTE_07590 [Blastochloris tepida]|uniref:Uncharacterized protein n=1 Tax=Blastochloris tepida TaxID=2233851 RepID=A0A348FXP1_9HYPH|nr:hypothetical protein BLTE_07590 [Blastochloris tepida]